MALKSACSMLEAFAVSIVLSRPSNSGRSIGPEVSDNTKTARQKLHAIKGHTEDVLKGRAANSFVSRHDTCQGSWFGQKFARHRRLWSVALCRKNTALAGVEKDPHRDEEMLQHREESITRRR